MHRVLVIILLGIIIVFIACTIFALIRPSGSAPLFRIGGITPDLQNMTYNPANGTTHVFTDIRGLRIPIGNPPTATVIVSISFTYPPDDITFTEEINARAEEFRSIAFGYFSSLSTGQIANFDENTAKSEILRQYNAILRLGSIETLFFYDLMIIE